MVNKNRWVSVQVFFVYLISILGIIGLLTACARNIPELNESHTQEPSFPKAFKGYELYIWEYDGEMWFTLITGTNREKGFDEIVLPGEVRTSDGWLKVTVQGLDLALKMLDQLPHNETLILMDLPSPGTINNPAYIYPPSQDLLNEIETYCLEKGLQLSQ